jgi:dTDP-4-amino-4,6-dideoxygalactose transaminase
MSRTEFLSFSPPSITEREVAAVAETLRKGWLSSGPKAKEFEEKFRAAVDAKAALALNSATAGLHLAMVLHDIGEGDEVITTPLTFCATANVIEHQGGTTVLADIDSETLLIDPQEIAKKVSTKTKVVVPVHYAGQPCDMTAIRSVAGHAQMVEDAAHCMPGKASIGTLPIGAADHLTLFSFYATKNITTGEGGMMTGSPELVDRARSLALHGMSRNAWDRYAKGGSWKYDVAQPGYKYNMPDPAASLGLIQLERVDELMQARMQIFAFYNEAFRGNPYIKLQKTRAGVVSSHHLYVIQLETERLRIGRDEFIVQMNERNIGVSVHFIPIHLHSYYAKKYGWTPESFPNATRAYERILSLPLNSTMSLKDAADVVEAVADICSKFKR